MKRGENMRKVTTVILSALLALAVGLPGCSGEEKPQDSGNEIGIEENWEDDYESEETTDSEDNRKPEQRMEESSKIGDTEPGDLEGLESSPE